MSMLTCDEIERHKELHSAFDELLACFLTRTEKRPSTTTCLELMQWSHEQATSDPTTGMPRPGWLRWQKVGLHEEALLGDPAAGDGVMFYLEHQPTCYRRGPWRLIVEVAGGPHHHDWGCLDDADQPERNYHSEHAARSEAQALADVLLKDRLAKGELPPVQRIDPPEDCGGGVMRTAEILDGTGASSYVASNLTELHKGRVLGLKGHCSECNAKPEEPCR